MIRGSLPLLFPIIPLSFIPAFRYASRSLISSTSAEMRQSLSRINQHFSCITPGKPPWSCSSRILATLVPRHGQFKEPSPQSPSDIVFSHVKCHQIPATSDPARVARRNLSSLLSSLPSPTSVFGQSLDLSQAIMNKPLRISISGQIVQVYSLASELLKINRPLNHLIPITHSASIRAQNLSPAHYQARI